MKKILTLILILTFLISSGIEVFAACSGTCTSCSTYTKNTPCTLHGCSWGGGSCSGICTACSTYSDSGSCEADSGCSWSDVCGDGVCASTEDCSCEDCEGNQGPCQVNYMCSGGDCVYSGSGGTCAQAGGVCKPDSCGAYVDCNDESGGSCTTGYCCSGSCTLPFSACGNGECEEGETCLTCETDCGSCTDQAINVAFREPLNKDIIKRGEQTLKVIVYFGRRPTSSAKVFAESVLFPAKLRLYDDGAHKDEKQFDGIYANQITLGKDAQPGEYKIKIIAEKDVSRDEETIIVTLDPKFRIKPSTIQETYVKGERINLNGIIEDFENAVQDVTVRLSLDRLGDVLYNKTYKTNKYGQFFDSYLISFADPDGEWKLKINAEDEDGNEGSLELKPRIGTPEGVAYYLVNFLSPIKGSSYSRGETVPITVSVSQEENPIKGAEVTFLSPKGEYLDLIELEPGVYTTNYKVLTDDPLGQWRLAVQAIKTIAAITRAGGNTIPLQIKSGEIRFEMLEPTDETALTGASLVYKIKVTYPDDSLVRGADLRAELSNNQTLTFFEEKPGIYKAEYFVKTEDTGALDAKIIATDTKGNTATLPSLLLHVEKRTIVELYLILFYRKVIRPFWWAILTFLIIAAMLYKPTYDIKSLRRKIRNVKHEQELLKNMQAEAEREYYKRRTISKTDFRRIIQGYKERLAKAKEQEKTAEERLKKKLKKPKKK